ncbi:hypothetical protein SAMN05660297_02931 [Natronincola peptidivorans]|uniref:Uncharacterized protein n=1 Tax=Natronincola peptidivorans TaxID=426128 RepID=A0A1I0FSX0_9FIRM|nr:hypothetical protein [Natronincola peptidivorans]SET61426.1 hypothetical protein SAMN05660297_02931 [Natronincola peptidivorans]
MKIVEIINQFIPEKLLYAGLILGVVGLFIIGLKYGDFTIIVGTVAALIAMFKYGVWISQKKN